MPVKLPAPAQIEENLKDAGCPDFFIQEFLTLFGNGTLEAQCRLLDKQRRFLLEQLHDAQRKLECFDYLRYQFIERKAH